MANEKFDIRLIRVGFLKLMNYFDFYEYSFVIF